MTYDPSIVLGTSSPTLFEEEVIKMPCYTLLKTLHLRACKCPPEAQADCFRTLLQRRFLGHFDGHYCIAMGVLKILDDIANDPYVAEENKVNFLYKIYEAHVKLWRATTGIRPELFASRLMPIWIRNKKDIIQAEFSNANSGE